jgi:energy-coupling factor transporter ATP-binding protein EcfA2
MYTSENIKLLAIRPLDNCGQRFTRSLKPGILYPFLQSYEFIEGKDNSIIEIIAHRDAEHLYNRPEVHGNNLNIQISAVVGENGSGKSSLVELFYLGIYLMAVQHGLLVLDVELPKYRQEKFDLEIIRETFKVELFYEVDGEFICLSFDSEINGSRNEERTNYRSYNIFQGERPPFTDMFYSIAVNYSIYGLNERSSGYWLRSLFHKNDGYRTPLVINPFRTWGNIDIFSEAHLAQSRLLANLKPSSNEEINILSNRSIRSIKFRKNVQKIRHLDQIPMVDVIAQLKKETGMDQDQLFETIFKALFSTDYLPQLSKRYSYRRIIETYVIKKIVKIAKNYPEYRIHFYTDQNEKNIPSIKHFNDFIGYLATDTSHITLKLRQALNTYRFNMLTTDPSQDVTKEGDVLVMPIQEFSRRIQAAHAQFPERELVEFIPNAILMPNIIMEDGSNFTNLSSGEQQLIHSMQSIIYHLNNLNSVFQVQSYERLTFKRVNIILDEIELYFHPEFQRRYITELLGQLRKLQIPHISAMNIIFLTHSPFILSDIPKGNILKLKNGYPVPQLDNTFAGNIHTMLSDSFFMKSTIGEFARQQCTAILAFYETVRQSQVEDLFQLISAYNTERKHFYFLVENIGEDVIAGALINHLAYLDQKLGFQHLDKDNEIEKLLEVRKQIDEDLRKRGYDQN